MSWLKQSTAVTVKIGPFSDSTDGDTDETGLTIAQADVRLSKNGGAFAQKNEASAATHDEHGYYSCSLNTTDTGILGSLRLAVHVSGALPVWHDFEVVSANVWDSLFGSDKLQVDVEEIGVDKITAAAIADDAITANAFAEDAVDANALATDAAQEIANAVGAGTVDTGFDLVTAVKYILAAQIGKMVVNGTNLEFYAQDGTTKLFTFDLDSSGRAVT